MSARGRLVAVGNAIVDVALRVPRLPPPGGDVLADAGEVTPGGIVNLVTAARRQDVPVTYAGTIGRGPFGELVRGTLREAGVDAPQAPRDEDTGFTVAITDGSGERTFLTSFGAERSLDEDLLAAARVGGGDVVCVSGYPLAMPGPARAVAAWLATLPHDVLLVADPGPLVADLDPAALGTLLDRADWWSCNTTEAAATTGGDSDPVSAARALARRTGRHGVVLRDGARGAVLLEQGGVPETVPAHPVDAVDSNGAGDTHVGVFAANLLRGLGARQAVRRANVAAAIAVTRRGPGGSPTAAEIDATLLR